MTEYKVEEVSAGCCSNTIRGPVVEKRINAMAKDGWKLERTETVIARKCCAQWYTLLIVYSREENPVQA